MSGPGCAADGGLRSGNSFVVTGDLITALDFSAQYGSEQATMGGNTAEKAWADLWFYSNPISVRMQR